jgi:GR25 family glycosyltransferase involved in LPS biosynthesis
MISGEDIYAIQEEVNSTDSKDVELTINIFFIHYSKLNARKNTMVKLQQTMSNIVKKNNTWAVDVKQVTKFDPENLTQEFVKRIFKNDELTEGNVMFNKFRMSAPQNNCLSNSLKHLDALNHISRYTKPEDVNFVFEDDVVFDNQFETLITEFIKKKCYQSYDLIFLGMPGMKNDDESSLNENKHSTDGGSSTFETMDIIPIVEKDKVLPCCDSYFITQECAKNLSNNFIPIRYPNNIQLSYILDKLNTKFGRAYPNIVADGSKLGFFSSSISPNNILLFNNTYKFIYKMLNKPDLTIEEGEHIKSLFTNNTFKDSPDFIFLEGLFYMRIQEYNKSKEFFDRAIERYEDQKSPLNNSSAIIQNYVELARHIQ